MGVSPEAAAAALAAILLGRTFRTPEQEAEEMRVDERMSDLHARLGIK